MPSGAALRLLEVMRTRPDALLQLTAMSNTANRNKTDEQLASNQRGNVMLLETQENSSFPRAQPCGKTPAIEESKDLLTRC